MPTPLRRQYRLLRLQTSFRLLFLATLASGVGTWMATIALTADLTDRTHSPWWVSALFVVTFVPSVVVGLLAGPLIDRLSRKRLIVAADILRLGVFVALPFVSSPAAFIALAAVAGVANSFFRPAVLAGVPNLLSEEDLAHGTTLLQITDWVAAALGPVLGGALYGPLGPDAIYWINAGTFLVSALLILGIPSRLLQSEQAITRGHWRDFADGFRVLRRTAALRVVLFAFAFAMFAVGLNNVAEIFLAERALDSGAFGYGLLWTAAGVGLVLGGIMSSSLLEQRDARTIYPLVFLPWAIGLLAAGTAPTIWIAAAGMVLSGFGNGLTFPMTVLIVQRFTEDRVRGRAFTLIISAHNAVLGVAMVTAGAILQSAGPRWTYVLCSVLLGLASLTAYALSRDLRAEHALAAERAT